MDLKEMIKVMQHYNNGGKVEHRLLSATVWHPIDYPYWDWSTYTYRIHPTETKQPLSAQDFTPGTVVREKSIPNTWYTVLAVTSQQFYFAEWYNHSFANTYFQEHYEYSTDQGKTWKNCYK